MSRGFVFSLIFPQNCTTLTAEAGFPGLFVLSWLCLFSHVGGMPFSLCFYGLLWPNLSYSHCFGLWSGFLGKLCLLIAWSESEN